MIILMILLSLLLLLLLLLLLFLIYGEELNAFGFGRQWRDPTIRVRVGMFTCILRGDRSLGRLAGKHLDAVPFRFASGIIRTG